jgi:hypothetical protein
MANAYRVAAESCALDERTNLDSRTEIPA